MKLLKTIFGNALVLATLLVAIAGSVLFAHAGRQTEPRFDVPDQVSKADEGTTRGPFDWKNVPRGSFVDAML